MIDHPSIQALKYVWQDPRWHPEGWRYEHLDLRYVSPHSVICVNIDWDFYQHCFGGKSGSVFAALKNFFELGERLDCQYRYTWDGLFWMFFKVCEQERRNIRIIPGTALVHTQLVVQQMENICDRENIQGEHREILVTAAYLHDIGKTTHTKWNTDKQRITSRGHAEASAEQCLEILGDDDEFACIVTELVREHMLHSNKGIGPRGLRRAKQRLKWVDPRDLLLLMEADMKGRGPVAYDPPEWFETFLEV